MGDHVKHLCDTAARVSAPGRPVGDRIYSNFTSVSGAAALCPVISLGARCGQALASPHLHQLHYYMCSVHPAPHLFLQLDGGECPGSPGHWALVRRGYCSHQIIVDSAAALLTQLGTVGVLHCC